MLSFKNLSKLQFTKQQGLKGCSCSLLNLNAFNSVQSKSFAFDFKKRILTGSLKEILERKMKLDSELSKEKSDIITLENLKSIDTQNNLIDFIIKDIYTKARMPVNDIIKDVTLTHLKVNSEQPTSIKKIFINDLKYVQYKFKKQVKINTNNISLLFKSSSNESVSNLLKSAIHKDLEPLKDEVIENVKSYFVNHPNVNFMNKTIDNIDFSNQEIFNYSFEEIKKNFSNDLDRLRCQYYLIKEFAANNNSTKELYSQKQFIKSEILSILLSSSSVTNYKVAGLIKEILEDSEFILSFFKIEELISKLNSVINTAQSFESKNNSLLGILMFYRVYYSLANFIKNQENRNKNKEDSNLDMTRFNYQLLQKSLNEHLDVIIYIHDAERSIRNIDSKIYNNIGEKEYYNNFNSCVKIIFEYEIKQINSRIRKISFLLDEENVKNDDNNSVIKEFKKEMLLNKFESDLKKLKNYSSLNRKNSLKFSILKEIFNRANFIMIENINSKIMKSNLEIKDIEPYIDISKEFYLNKLQDHEQKLLLTLLFEYYRNEVNYRKCFEAYYEIFLVNLKCHLKSHSNINYIPGSSERIFLQLSRYSSIMNKSERNNYDEVDFSFLINLFNYAVATHQIVDALNLFTKIERINLLNSGKFFDKEELIQFYYSGARMTVINYKNTEAINILNYIRLLNNKPISDEFSFTIASILNDILATELNSKNNLDIYLKTLLEISIYSTGSYKENILLKLKNINKLCPSKSLEKMINLIDEKEKTTKPEKNMNLNELVFVNKRRKIASLI